MLLTLKEAIHTVHPTRSALARSLGLGLVALAALLACSWVAHRLAPSPALLICAAAYLAVVAARYNATALVYLPAYALAGLAGHALSRWAGRARAG